MNHDVLRNALHGTMLQVYKLLYEEYKNEDKAKRGTVKLTQETLQSFGDPTDIVSVYNRLVREYNAIRQDVTKEAEVRALKGKLETLEKAIGVLREIDT